jgi:pimeloyl-ACP methyl ester carboxylesterase
MEVDRGGVAVHYDVAGSGPAILLSHGFGASSHMFRPNAPALTTDHTLITWDQRGHGGSDSPADPDQYSTALAVADMAAILDAAGVERAVVGGHSLGGYLSLAFHVAHPDRVAALVLIDTGPGYRSDDGRQKWNRMAESYAADLEQRGLAALGGSGELTPSVHRDASGLVHAARRVLTQADAAVVDSLPAIAVPVLVVVGERDKPFLAGSSYMADKIPDAQLVVIPGAAHAPNVTHTAEFDAHVRTFLDRLEVPR